MSLRVVARYFNPFGEEIFDPYRKVLAWSEDAPVGVQLLAQFVFIGCLVALLAEFAVLIVLVLAASPFVFAAALFQLAWWLHQKRMHLKV